jgi:multiple sugar transport system substrate-binding protein
VISIESERELVPFGSKQIDLIMKHFKMNGGCRSNVMGRIQMIRHFQPLMMLAPLLLSSCNSPQLDRQGILRVWAHSGQAAETQVLKQQIERFNKSQTTTTVKLILVPEGNYNAQVQAAALSQDLPDVLEFDGPFVYNYVWQQNLIPIDRLISESVKQDLLPSAIAQGTYQGKLYSVGTFDSGLGLYGRRSKLQAAGIRIPTGNQDAWTISEFDAALAALAKRDPDRRVLDLKLNYRGEWSSYGFLPIIQSAGGQIDRSLNSPAAVTAMRSVQTWIQKGYVDPNIDEAAFTKDRVALSWVGHWAYKDYDQAIGRDLVVLPLPNFGRGSKTAQGSWNWGVTTNCASQSCQKSARSFLEFLLQPEEVLAMADVNGAVPGTKQAIARSKLYAPNGPLRLFAAQLLAGQTVPRPQTPAYPVITSAFQEAFANIRNGLPVKTALDRAATTINVDLQDNQNYPNSIVGQHK